MTRKEAIKNLKELLKRYLEEELLSETVYKREAVDMAISALSTEGEYIKKEDLFNKTIKRNSIWNGTTNAEGKGLEEIVNDLPTYTFPNSAENKGDLISRQAVLDELEKWDWQELYLPIHFKQILDDVPSADVRPNIHGHWIKINSGDEDFPESIVCDRCNHENSHLDFNEHNEPIGKVFVTSNFCPNCGADMSEPKGEKGTT